MSDFFATPWTIACQAPPSMGQRIGCCYSGLGLGNGIDCKEWNVLYLDCNGGYMTVYICHLRFVHLKQVNCIGYKLKEGWEGDNRGWDDWMASLTQWTWVWANSGDSEGQGSLACCSPWGHKKSDTTERLNWNIFKCSPAPFPFPTRKKTNTGAAALDLGRETRNWGWQSHPVIPGSLISQPGPEKGMYFVDTIAYVSLFIIAA